MVGSVEMGFLDLKMESSFFSRGASLGGTLANLEIFVDVFKLFVIGSDFNGIKLLI